MKQTLFAFMITGLIAVVVTLSLSELNQTITDKNNSQAAYMDAYGRAQAMIITAQASAQREFTIAALPWVILGIALVSGTVAIIYLVRSPITRPDGAQLIERRIIYYLPHGPEPLDLPKITEVKRVRH